LSLGTGGGWKLRAQIVLSGCCTHVMLHSSESYHQEHAVPTHLWCPRSLSHAGCIRTSTPHVAL